MLFICPSLKLISQNYRVSFNSFVLQTNDSLFQLVIGGVDVAIKQYFLGILSDIIFCGIASRFYFSIEENSICDNDMAAKIEFLQLHKDAHLKTDLIR